MKRGKPLKRVKALQRKTWMPRRRVTRRRSERVRNLEHLHAVHALPCWLKVTENLHECSGPMEADHAGQRPMGRKSDDDEAIPLCRQAHRDRTSMSGVFRSWKKSRMRAWLDDGIAWTRAHVALAPGGA